MVDIWEKEVIERLAIRQGEEVNEEKAQTFYKYVIEQYNICPDKITALMNVKFVGDKYGIYRWYSSKAKELLDCYEELEINEKDEIPAIENRIKEIDKQIKELNEEILKKEEEQVKLIKNYANKIHEEIEKNIQEEQERREIEEQKRKKLDEQKKDLEYKEKQNKKCEEIVKKFNDLLDGKIYVDSTSEYQKWVCYKGTSYIGKETTKEQLELKRREAILNAIRINELHEKKVKTTDIGKIYQIDTKIKSLEEKIIKTIETIENLTLYTYYKNKIVGIKDLKESIEERKKEMQELNYPYAKAVIYKITYKTINNIMCMEDAILHETR